MLVYNYRLETVIGNLLLRFFLEPTPLAVCDFNEDLCGWTNDPNNWKYRWMRVTKMNLKPLQQENPPFLCLSAKPAEEKKVKKQSSSWLPTSIKKDRKNTQSNLTDDIQARLWSESVPVEVGLHCLTLSYKIYLGHTAGSTETSKRGTLAVLQRQAGC